MRYQPGLTAEPSAPGAVQHTHTHIMQLQIGSAPPTGQHYNHQSAFFPSQHVQYLNVTDTSSSDVPAW